MTAGPLISVLIPVYNTGEYLADCLDSVLGQSYANLEIIAVNDGSSDNSQAILEGYARRDPRVRVIDKPNEGVMATRRRSVEEASGEFIFFVDSDDYIDTDYIRKLYDALVSSGLDAASGEIVKVRGGVRTVIERDTPDTMTGTDYLRHLLRHDVFGAVAGRLYRAGLLKKVEYFPGISLMDDYIINVQVAMEPGFRGICFVRDAFYYYIHHEGSIVHRRIGFDYIEKFAAVFDPLFDARPDLAAEFGDELFSHRISRYHMYIKRSGNPWMGNRPLALKTWREVRENRRRLKGIVPGYVVTDIMLYRHRWLRPLVMVSSVIVRWKKSLEKRRKHKHRTAPRSQCDN